VKPFEIVAHRGITETYPENTIPAFEDAIEQGADAVEFDVRLTSDSVPVVFHYFYLDEITQGTGTIFNYPLEQLRGVEVGHSEGKRKSRLSTFSEVLDAIGGRIGLEIEIKGPEPESAKIISDILDDHKSIWNTIEVTSYEPVLLQEFRKNCPDIPTDLLFPRSETWMKLDVVQYMAIHRSRLAGARAVHLHPTQLTPNVVNAIKNHKLDIHAWDVNDEQALSTCLGLGITRICTDNFQQAKSFRQRLFLAN
jgi:glycerophosphoryl diester phosphodiesterase